MTEPKEEFAKRPELQPWNISEDKFPSKGSYHDKLRFFINYAILAPSSHNTQPWLFKVVDNTIELYADRTRGLQVVDPEDRELTISCGAALFHLLLAIRHFGFTYKLEILPNEEDVDLLAQVNLEDKQEQSEEENLLFQAITKRRTNRSKFEDKEIPESLLSKLQSSSYSSINKEFLSQSSTASPATTTVKAVLEQVWLHFSKDKSEKVVLADLIAEGDRIQMSDKRFRRELASWIHQNRSHSKDGMPGYAFGFNEVMSLMGPFVIRTFDAGKGQSTKDRQLATGSPILAVIGTKKSDKPIDWIVAGMILSKTLLLARSQDVWCSFLNQPIEVAELRHKVTEAINEEGFPQVLMRMGYGKEDVIPTPRRSAEEILH